MNCSELTYEKNLLEKLREGDNNAFLELYNKYHPALYHYVLRFVKVPAMAEDVLQEVFMKIWEIRERVNPELSFQAYLYKITRNSVFTLMKKITKDVTLRREVMKQLQENISDGDLQLIWKQYNEILYAAIADLSVQRQKVFRLCREEGKTYDQAASELGISRNTVKEHIVLATRSIKSRFLQNRDISLPILLLLAANLFLN